MKSFLKPKKIAKGAVRTFANVPAWMGYGFIKENIQGVVQFISPVFEPAKAKRQETFEAAMKRMQLSEADLLARAKDFRLYSLIYFGFALAIVIYAFYMLWFGHGFAFLISSVLAGLALIKAVSYRFWLFQIRNRKLGCSFKDWWRGKVEN